MGLFSAINEKKYLNEIAELKKQAEEQQEKIDELQNEIRTLHESYNTLNEKYAYYKETFETLDTLQLEKKAANYLTNRRRTLALANLINEVSNEQSVGIERLKKELDSAVEKRNKVHESVCQANHNEIGQSAVNDEAFTFEKTDGGIEITGYTGFETKGELYIPETIQGESVVGIGRSAFKNAEFSTVRLPNTLEYIKGDAFYGCKNLENINFPVALKSLNSFCFAGTNLKSVAIPAGIKAIPGGCFSDCKNLKSVILNKGLQTIEMEAFASTAIRKIVIPENVTSIDEGAFGKSGLDPGYIGPSGISFAFARMGDIFVHTYNSLGDDLGGKPIIYCLAGSKIQQIAKERGYIVRPLSEFKM